MKNYLTAFLDAPVNEPKNRKVTESELTKLTKYNSVSFVSDHFGEIQKKHEDTPQSGKPFLDERNISETKERRTDKTDRIQIPEDCSLCRSKLSAADSPALIVRFCSFGCELTWQAFADWDAAYGLAKDMFEAATYDECCAMSDALAERAAIFVTENSFEPEDAVREAEADLIPRWLDEFRLKNRTDRNQQ